MKLSKPALLSAFLCPGMGHWAAGWRSVGAFLVALAVLSGGAPFAAFLWGFGRRTLCFDGVWICTTSGLAHAWSVAWPVLIVAGPVFVLVYVGALLHAMTLTLPGDDLRH